MTRRIKRELFPAATQAGRRVVAVTPTYGYFPMLPFLMPWTRRSKVEWLLDMYVNVRCAYPGVPISYIGHSNGTYVVAGALDRCPAMKMNNVVFAGSVPHAEAARCYSVCDVLVYPRKSMRLTELVTPLKPLEAMAAGKTVIGSNVGGLRELIREGDTGLLFPAGDSEALAEVLRSTTRDEALRQRLGEAGRQHVCREREWRSLIRVHLETYRRLLGPESPPALSWEASQPAS